MRFLIDSLIGNQRVRVGYIKLENASAKVRMTADRPKHAFLNRQFNRKSMSSGRLPNCAKMLLHKPGRPQIDQKMRFLIDSLIGNQRVRVGCIKLENASAKVRMTADRLKNAFLHRQVNRKSMISIAGLPFFIISYVKTKHCSSNARSLPLAA